MKLPGMNGQVRGLLANDCMKFVGKMFHVVVMSLLVVLCGRVAIAFDRQVRLAGGDQHEGRVEVYRNGQWGTICDDEWDIRDAGVACRELGYQGALAAESGSFFGPGKGPIFLDNVDCAGGESRLVDCPHNGWLVHDCYHGEDAGVRCDAEASRNLWYILGGTALFVAIVFSYIRSRYNTRDQQTSLLSTVTSFTRRPLTSGTGVTGSTTAPTETCDVTLPTLSGAVRATDDRQAQNSDNHNWQVTLLTSANHTVVYSTAPRRSADNVSPPPSYDCHMASSRSHPSTAANSSTEVNDSAPPPSYEDVVAGKCQGTVHF